MVYSDMYFVNGSKIQVLDTEDEILKKVSSSNKFEKFKVNEDEDDYWIDNSLSKSESIFINTDTILYF